MCGECLVFVIMFHSDDHIYLFVPTLEDHRSFPKSCQACPALGLVPRRDWSGDHESQLRITTFGDAYLRQLMVNCAHYILGPFGPDCDLRRWGLQLVERGRKNAKKRAAVGIARKLAVLLHHLWKTGDQYDPFFQSGQPAQEPLIQLQVPKPVSNLSEIAGLPSRIAFGLRLVRVTATNHLAGRKCQKPSAK
jgi:hypothetical protein